MTTRVIVTGIVPGDPPMLAWHKRLRGVGGKEKVHTQWVPVLDRQVLERLRCEVQPGDEIEVTIVTDWSAAGAPTHLADFAGASAAHARRAGTSPGS